MIDLAKMHVLACRERSPHVQLHSDAHRRVATITIKDYDEAVAVAKALLLGVRIAALAAELCDAIDSAEADIGGCRSPTVIIGEIGPLTVDLQRLQGLRP